MNNNKTSVSGVEGLATLTHIATVSPLRMGEVSIHKPFEALSGVDIHKLKCIPVSQKKFDTAARKQHKSQQFYSTHVTLLKKIDEHSLNHNPDFRLVESILNKKPVRVQGKLVAPPLTFKEIIIISMAEYALMEFKTLTKVKFKISFYENNEEFEYYF